MGGAARQYDPAPGRMWPWTCPSCRPSSPCSPSWPEGCPNADDMLYEPKWDGFRCIVFRDGDEVELGSRNERPLTRYFPEVVEVVKARAAGAVRRRRRDRDRRRTAVWTSTRLQLRIHPAGVAGARSWRGRYRRRSWPSTCWRWATSDLRSRPLSRAADPAGGGARRRQRRRCTSRPRPGPRRGRRLVRAVRGRGARRRDRQAARHAVPAGQAGHAQGEARAHGRLRRGRVPLAQERAGRRLAAARACTTTTAACITSASPRRSRWRRAQAAGRRARALPRGCGRGPSVVLGREASDEDAPPGRRPESHSSAGTQARTCRSSPLRPELVVEVAYDHMQGDALPARRALPPLAPGPRPAACTYKQLDTAVPEDLSAVFGAL